MLGLLARRKLVEALLVVTPSFPRTQTDLRVVSRPLGLGVAVRTSSRPS